MREEITLDQLKGRNLKRKRYGMGKFEGNYNSDLGQALHNATMESWQDEEVGSSSDGPGWAGLFKDLRDLKIKEDGQRVVGAIVEESTTGFFDYETFSNKKKLMRAWKEKKEELEPEYTEE